MSCNLLFNQRHVLSSLYLQNCRYSTPYQLRFRLTYHFSFVHSGHFQFLPVNQRPEKNPMISRGLLCISNCQIIPRCSSDLPLPIILQHFMMTFKPRLLQFLNDRCSHISTTIHLNWSIQKLVKPFILHASAHIQTIARMIGKSMLLSSATPIPRT